MPTTDLDASAFCHVAAALDYVRRSNRSHVHCLCISPDLNARVTRDSGDTLRYFMGIPVHVVPDLGVDFVIGVAR